MAGTKEHLCKTCKFDNFKTWLIQKEDVCFLCQEASKWIKKEKS